MAISVREMSYSDIRTNKAAPGRRQKTKNRAAAKVFFAAALFYQILMGSSITFCSPGEGEGSVQRWYLASGNTCQVHLDEGFLHAAAEANPLICPLITSSFSCTIFPDIVCCLLSNVCVVTSFCRSLQAMSSFLLFSICATYCTLSDP